MKCVLHIGTEKTGTTALQTFLARNRGLLLKRGVYCPTSSVSGPRGNHLKLAPFACRDDKRDDLHAMFGIGSQEQLERFRVDLREGLRRELAAVPTSMRVAVFSSEHCHSRILEADEVERLRALLSEFFSEVRVVVYLRPQDEVMVSLYSTAIRAGSTEGLKYFLENRDWSRFLDYPALLRRWAQGFGEHNLAVRLYDEAVASKGALVGDFLRLVEAWPLENAVTPPAVNTSFSAEGQEFLRRLNAFLPVNGKDGPNPKRQLLLASVDRALAGSSRRPARAWAKKCRERFKPDNEAVRAAWFPHKSTLFSDDLSKYPEKQTPAELDPDAAVKQAAALLGEASRVSRNRIARAHLQHARVYGRLGLIEEAMRAIDEAQALDPNAVDFKRLRATLREQMETAVGQSS